MTAKSRRTAVEPKGPWWSTTLFAVLAITAGGLLAYHNSFRVPFVLDDDPAIVANPSIRSLATALWPPDNIQGTPISGRPVVNFSFGLNYAISGTRVWSYHVVNLAIHLLAGLTLFGIARRTLSFLWSREQDGVGRVIPNPPVSGFDSRVRRVKDPAFAGRLQLWFPVPERLRRTSNAPYPPSAAAALAIALLWTLHPLQTESVTYISQRAESLLGLLFLLTLYCFIRAVEAGSGEPALQRSSAVGRGLLTPPVGWSALSMAACLLGMITKEVMYAAPLIAALYDRAFVCGSWREVWARHRGLLLALASTWVVLAWVVVHEGGARGASAGFGLGVSSWTYLLTQCKAIVLYLKLCLWPHPLVLDYGTAVVRSAAQVWPEGLLVLGLLVLTLLGLYKKPAAGFLGAWFFLILAPSSSVIPLVGQTMAEHRMYLPLAAVIALVVVGLYRLTQAAGDQGTKGSKDQGTQGSTDQETKRLRDQKTKAEESTNDRQVSVGLTKVSSGLGPLVPWSLRPLAFWSFGLWVPVLALALAWLTACRNRDYATAISIGEDTVAKRPANARAMALLADYYRRAGQLDKARQWLERSLAVEPRVVPVLNNLGDVWQELGEPARAATCFQQVLALSPRDVTAHNNLGNALVLSGRVTEGIGELEAALRLAPDSGDTRRNLAHALAQSGRLAEADEQFTALLRQHPDDADARADHARVLEALGRRAEALAELEAAVATRPADADLRDRLGVALGRAGQVREALAQFQEALRLNPGDAVARENAARAQRYLDGH